MERTLFTPYQITPEMKMRLQPSANKLEPLKSHIQTRILMNPNTPRRSAQYRELPLFRWAATQNRPITYAQRHLSGRFGITIAHARLIEELQRYGGASE